MTPTGSPNSALARQTFGFSVQGVSEAAAAGLARNFVRAERKFDLMSPI
jgi:hypothetical protein